MLKNSKLRIGLDIDEVLADFMGAYIDRFGETPSHVITQNCVNVLSNDRTFWEGLKVLRTPDFDLTLYCTKRVNPKSYTKRWLQQNGFPNAPIYQIYDQMRNKADLIKGRVDVFIDDSPFNVKAMNQAGLPCLLMNTPYNRDFKTPLRVYSLTYDEIIDAYERNFREWD